VQEVQALKQMLEPLRKLSDEQSERIRELEAKHIEFEQKEAVIQEESTGMGGESYDQVVADRDAKILELSELEERFNTIQTQAEEASQLKSELTSLQEQLQHALEERGQDSAAAQAALADAEESDKRFEKF
jgi:hypothetical protein